MGNMTAVNQTELEEALKEIEEQGEDLDFNFINKTFNLSSMNENNTVEVDVEQYDAEEEEDEIVEVDDEVVDQVEIVQESDEEQESDDEQPVEVIEDNDGHIEEDSQ